MIYPVERISILCVRPSPNRSGSGCAGNVPQSMSLRPVIEWAINPRPSTRIHRPTADIDDGQVRCTSDAQSLAAVQPSNSDVASTTVGCGFRLWCPILTLGLRWPTRRRHLRQATEVIICHRINRSLMNAPGKRIVQLTAIPLMEFREPRSHFGNPC